MGTHRAEHVGNEPDPYGSIQQHRRLPSLLHTLHVGMTADQWVITDPETSMLVIAPPRSPGGKTRSVAVATPIMAAGPTLAPGGDGGVASAVRLGAAGHVRPGCHSRVSDRDGSRLGSGAPWRCDDEHRGLRVGDDPLVGRHAHMHRVEQARETAVLLDRPIRVRFVADVLGSVGAHSVPWCS